ncbi:MAG: hypothetical protein M0Z77_00735 [Thermoplasmatales archaeon]|nr:hypothetical protein [Thermoplasmatales archaeon]
MISDISMHETSNQVPYHLRMYRLAKELSRRITRQREAERKVKQDGREGN